MTSPSPQRISPLDRVPDEILNEIFDHIAIDTNFRDECGNLAYGPRPSPLLATVQVNRRFNAVASPLMVRKWRLELKYHMAGSTGFVRHLLKQANLRSQVRSLALFVDFAPVEFDWNSQRGTKRNRWPPSFIPTVECEQLAESAEKACAPLAGLRYKDKQVSWPSEVGLRSPTAISALVVAWATELQELDLTLVGDAHDTRPDPWLFQLVKLATGALSPYWTQVHDLLPPAMFTKLRSVTLANCTYPTCLRHYHDLQSFSVPVPLRERNLCLINPGDNDENMRGTHAAVFFRLPNLRVFKAYSMDAEGLTLDEADQSGTGTALQPPADQLFPNGTSNVEEIKLYWSYVSANGLGVLTRACKRLRVLVLEWGPNFWNVYDSTFSTALLEAIKIHSDSLEEILVDGIGRTLIDLHGAVDPEPFEAWFLRCNKLERLAINLEILYGDEDFERNSFSYPLAKILPTGLSSLTLGLGITMHGGLQQATKDNVSEFLCQCGPNGRFPKLRKLQLMNCMMDFDKDQDLTILARNAGVVLTTRRCVRLDC